MERLSEQFKVVLDDCIDSISQIQNEVIEKATSMLESIEEIMGDDYDLFRLRKLVEADRDQEFQRHLKRFDNVLPKKPHWIEQMDRDAIQRWLTRSLTTNGISEDRLREICEADREGRIVVLPCKIGETVWRIYDDCEFPGDCGTKRMCRGCEYRNLFTEAQAFCLSMLSQNGNLEHPYYMSIKAAEAALKGEQHGKDL